ncbi:MAG: CPXCG motif-containing cysteine-rich protein [Gammaproteobacteria bacterium]|nr:CPXCG motif-containing cysteine-rich protein [Gammaproteobacteria bacterium]
MEGLVQQALTCPYCGEAVTAEADPAAGPHDFIEDCPVCCRPIEYRFTVAADGGWALFAARDDDA